MKLADAHTHLSGKDFDEDRDEVTSRAFEVCDFLIDIGIDEDKKGHKRAQAFAEAYPQAYFTAGVHPHDAKEQIHDEALWEDFQQSWTHKKCVAVGECGLDYYYENSPKQEQRDCFEKHIKAAQKVNLPLMIHTRDAEGDTMELLKNYDGKAVFHCFTGSERLAKFGVEKGFFVSFSGIITFKKAEDLRQIFLKLPLDQILIETDSPFLAPVPMRGKRNESSYIKHTAEFLAKLRGLDLNEFAQITRENSLRLFDKIKLEIS